MVAELIKQSKIDYSEFISDLLNRVTPFTLGQSKKQSV